MNSEWNRAYCIGLIEAIVRDRSHATPEEMVEQVRKALDDLKAQQEK